jgi:hypothetical protein
LISRGYYDDAEKLLRRIAKINDNAFDTIAYQRLVTEEKKVIHLRSLIFLIILLERKFECREKPWISAYISIESDVYYRNQYVISMVCSKSCFLWCFTKYWYEKKEIYIFFDLKKDVLGAWLLNPYISFAAGAIVEIFAYLIVHLVLHRWGRKVTYCSFVIGFAVFAFLVVPIQILMIKDSHGIIFI